MAITYNEFQTTYPAYIYSYDGSSYSSNLNGSSAFDYFSDTAAADNAIYFGSAVNSGKSRSISFRNLNFYVGTGLVASAITLVWEYYDGSAWSALTNVADNTNSFQTTGENSVTWDYPTDWKRTTVNGIEAFWIRCRISSVTGISEGGAQSTQAVEGGDNMIVVTGGTEGTPLTFEDIYDADVAGGWNVFVKLSAKAYKSYARLQFGDASTPTYFTDTNVLLITMLMNYIRAACTLTLGELVNGVGVNGCDWRHELVAINGGFLSAYGLYTANFYGSRFYISDGARNEITFLNGTLTAVDCFFGRELNLDFNSGTINLTRCIMYCYSQIYRVDDTFVDNLAPSYLNSINANPTIYGLVTPEFRYASSVGHTRAANLVNCDITSITCSWIGSYTTGSMTTREKYSFDLKVIDANGDAISGATVVIKDVTGVEVYNDTSDANGEITQQELVKQINVYTDSTATTVYTPHTITISATGYQTKTMVLTMDRKREEVVVLEKAVKFITAGGDPLLWNLKATDSQNKHNWVKV